jgi:hypothetical protein
MKAGNMQSDFLTVRMFSNGTEVKPLYSIVGTTPGITDIMISANINNTGDFGLTCVPFVATPSGFATAMVGKSLVVPVGRMLSMSSNLISVAQYESTIPTRFSLNVSCSNSTYGYTNVAGGFADVLIKSDLSGGFTVVVTQNGTQGTSGTANGANAPSVNEQFSSTTLNASLWFKPTWEGDTPANVVILPNGTLSCYVNTAQGAASIASIYGLNYGYGDYEIRMKFPNTDPNLRGAFWLRNGDLGEEIDIEYYKYNPNSIDLTLYNYGDQTIAFRRYNATSDLSLAFHTWKITWLSDKVIWYLDGTEIFRYVGADVPKDSQTIRAKADNPTWRPAITNPGYTLVDYITYTKA